MQKSPRFKRISRLPPFATLVVPTPVVAEGYEGLDLLVEGFTADFITLLERLGGVRVHSYLFEASVDGDPSNTQPLVSTQPLADGEVDELLLENDADRVVAITLDWKREATAATIHIALRGEGGKALWTGTHELADGAVWQGRLTMASEVIAAATGEPIDVRPFLSGGTTGLEAYRLMCEARCDRLHPYKQLERIKDVVELEPENADAALLLTDVLAGADMQEQADPLILSLPDRFPDSGRASLRRGMFLHVRSEAQAARADILNAIRQDMDGLALYEAGRYLLAVGDEEAGGEALQGAVEHRCADPFLYEQLGVLRANEGQEVAAVVLWERALALDSQLHGIIANLALGHHRLGNEDRADELFVLAEEKAGEHFATHYNLGLYYQDLKSWDLARKHLEKAIEIRPTLAVLHLNLGLVLARLGDLRRARDSFSESARLDPTGPVGKQADDELGRIIVAPVDPVMDAREYFQKGADRIKANRSPKAIPYLKEAVKIAPRYWQAWFYLGTCYRLDERWEASVEAFRKVVAINDDQADAHNELSVALGQTGRKEDALHHARRAHELRPDDAGIISNLGLALMELNHFDEARHHFSRAHKLAPEDQIVQRCLEELDARENKA